MPIVALLLSAEGTRLDAAEELPGGSSPEIRAKMVDWENGDGDGPYAKFPEVRSAMPERQGMPLLSSHFGDRRDPFDGRLRLHSGVDMPAPLGSTVLAVAPGSVRLAARMGRYGQLVEIDHGSGLRTRYAHLLRILVVPGERVEAGQTIGLVGTTGRSTGSHLHFEVRRDGIAVDPLPYMRGEPGPWPSANRTEESAAGRPHVSAYALATENSGDADGDER